MVHHEVADVRDAKRQRIAARTVLAARRHAPVFLGQTVKQFLLLGDLALGAFEDQRARRHLLGVEALDLGHEQLLELGLLDFPALGRRLERHGELELHVVHEANRRGRLTGLREIVHERDAGLEIRKQHRAIGLHFRQGEQLDHGAGDDAELAFAAEQPQARIDADGLARGDAVRSPALGRASQLAGGGDHGHVQDQILDVAVTILLHSAGMRRDPAAHGRKLDAVRLVAHREAVFRQLLGDVATDRARFDARHAVDRIDPTNPRHSPHVDRDDGALLIVRAAQGIGDVGAAAIRDQHHAVARRRLDQLFDLVFARRPEHDVGNARQLAELQRVHLLLGVAVAMAQAGDAVLAPLIRPRERGEILHERAVTNGRGNLRRKGPGVDVVDRQIAFHRLADPRQ